MDTLILLFTFFLGILTAYIGAFIPGISSSLTISSLMLLGVPPQIAKTTFQIGAFGLSVGGLRQLLQREKFHKEHIIPFVLICLVGGYIGGSILISIPTDLLVKLTGVSMIIFLIVNIFSKDLGIISREISRKRKWFGYIGYFLMNVFGTVFPMGIGVAYQFFYTFVFRMTILESKLIGKITYFPFLIGLVIPVFLSGFYDLGAILAFALGTYIGSHFGVKHGILLGNTLLKKIIILWLLFIGLYFLFFA